MVTTLYELQQRMKFTTPTKYCGVIIGSKNSQTMVFDVFNQNNMRPSFDIYIDCGLAELAMTVETSKRLAKLKARK